MTQTKPSIPDPCRLMSRLMTGRRSVTLTAVLAAMLAACGQPEQNTGSTEETPQDMTQQTVQDVPADHAGDAAQDPYLWLEEVEGEEALAWVEARNTVSKARLEGHPAFQSHYDKALAVYNAEDKIPYGELLGGAVHNFWQDSTNVRGLWRRTGLDSYRDTAPDWQTILDLDALADAEGENWVYKGRDCLAPDFNRCLVRLSRGGGDAVVVREFDIEERSFVENGFVSPESKQWLAWVDSDTLMIATDFGDGTMNESGYPRQVRLWKRGMPLSDARLILDSDPALVFNFPMSSHRRDGTYAGVIQGPDFFTQILHLWVDDDLKTLPLPREIDFKGFFADWMLIQMRKDWSLPGGKKAASGSLVAVRVADALAGTPGDSLTSLFEPDDRQSIDDVQIGQDRVYLSVLDNVTGRLISAAPQDSAWVVTDIAMPENGTLSLVSVDEWRDAALIGFESFLQADTLYLAGNTAPTAIKALPARFDAGALMVEQRAATSRDGTRIPYFVIRPENFRKDGSAPTMLYGYGGFEIALTPSYLTGFSQLWVENGGTYVVANIRGGGEFGPRWHQAALKANRQRAYDDFIAVAEDLVAAGYTSPARLGIRGGSNGGLLVGATFTQRPDLFGAVICAVPLLDMRRYDKLLAGASWVGEYGDPDNPDEWAFIREYSPYQNVAADADYPEIFFFTSTKDDRVHPGHARKMAAKMTDQGHEIIYYENTEGGHAAAANLKQRAFTDALQMIYASQSLMKKE